MMPTFSSARRPDCPDPACYPCAGQPLPKPGVTQHGPLPAGAAGCHDQPAPAGARATPVLPASRRRGPRQAAAAAAGQRGASPCSPQPGRGAVRRRPPRRLPSARWVFSFRRRRGVSSGQRRRQREDSRLPVYRRGDRADPGHDVLGRLERGDLARSSRPGAGDTPDVRLRPACPGWREASTRRPAAGQACHTARRRPIRDDRRRER